MNYKFLNASFIISLLVFNYFFWQENLGINLTVFSFLLTALLYISNRKSFEATNVRVTLAGTIVTSLMVLFFNSSESKFAHIFSFMLMVAFIHETGLRSVMFAVMHVLSGILKVPAGIYERRRQSLQKLPRLYFALRIIKLSVIPLSVAAIFFTLYCFANPIFGNYADKFFEKLNLFFKNFFENISLARILFFLFGALILSVVFFRNETKIFLQKDLSFREKLERVRSFRNDRSFRKSLQPFKSIELKNQNRRGIILLLMVNILLVVENVIDIKWLWFGFELPEAFSLKHYVREGTGFLIISIMLSMGVLLYYFRKNQNFYPRNKLLKTLAYLWILQNAVLCISVLMRNYHYIDFHGLAYKRIGVIVFLVLTIVGLFSLYNKIKNVKTEYYLLKVNTWALYVMLVFLSCFNWDVRIAHYNLSHWNKGEIDVDFYLKLSDKAMPLVFQNLNVVKEQIEAHNNNKVRWIRYRDYDIFLRDLKRKNEKFLTKYKEHSWLSFNFQDEKAFRELSKKQLVEN